MAAIPASPALLILKILTPVSIAKMTRLVNRDDRISLTKILMKEEEDRRPIKDTANIEPKTIEIEKVAEEGSFESKDGVPLMDNDQSNLAAPSSMTVFLMNQKERLKKSQQKLKKKEILSLYESSAAININQEHLENDENLSGSFQCGTLLDKKQY